MDELEILKRDWKKNENSYNQVSEQQIYGMLHKRSSSIVKWILIISILEIALWLSLSLLFKDTNYQKAIERSHLGIVYPTLIVINYVIIAYFIYLFYRNFKAIKATESVKKLMQNILKTRKTVKHYVWYNLIMGFVSFIIIACFQIIYDPTFQEISEKVSLKINTTTFYIIIIFIYIIVGIVMIGIIWLFYKLLYGFLTKRLFNNYKELEKLDL